MLYLSSVVKSDSCARCFVYRRKADQVPIGDMKRRLCQSLNIRNAVGEFRADIDGASSIEMALKRYVPW